MQSAPQSALPTSLLSDALGRLLLSVGCVLSTATPAATSASDTADIAGTMVASATEERQACLAML